MSAFKNTNGRKPVHQVVDDTIMKGVNAGVRAWNWSTGRTKADLANTMLTVAPVLESVGWVNSSFGPAAGAMVGGLCLTASHLAQIHNKEIEAKEVRAINGSLINMEVERYKYYASLMAPVWGFNAALWGFGFMSHPHHSMLQTRATDYCTAVGNGLRGVSYYVMRADYLPPRKNALARGWNNSKEFLRSLNSSLPVPEPAFGLIALRGAVSSGPER